MTPEAREAAPAAPPATAGPTRPRVRVIPGFSLTMGYTVLYLSLIVLIPLSATVAKTLHLSWREIWETLADKEVLLAFRLSILASLAGAAVNAVAGLLVAWVLVRYDFPGRRLLDALVDLPFALPTAVAGISLTAIYAPNGWMGRWLEPLGIKVAYTPLGVALALAFIGLPFVVRTVQPVLEELDPEVEEAAACLGAGRWQVFRLVILPTLFPSLLTGASLAFARALGEYGSVIFISGNMPYRTEIVPLIIVSKLEQYQYSQATAVAVAMLLLSFALLLGINLLQRWSGRHRVAH